MNAVLTIQLSYLSNTGDAMKILNPKLKGYTALNTGTQHRFFIKPEHTSGLNTEEYVQDFLAQVDRDGYISNYEIDGFEFLGDGSFSKVVVHPEDDTKVIKMMLRYEADSTVYQYYRLIKDDILNFDWCPSIYDMGRIKMVKDTWKHKLQDMPKHTIIDMAYVVMDRLTEKYRSWADRYECPQLQLIEDEFREHVLSVYFPYAKLDVRGANVLADADGNLFATDPVWNSSENYLERDYIDSLYIELTPPKTNQVFMNNLRKELTHGRVW